MTLEEVQAAVQRIRKFAEEKDGPGAHIHQDSLFENVLLAIAAGAANPKELAAAAVVVADLDFDRWYE